MSGQSCETCARVAQLEIALEDALYERDRLAAKLEDDWRYVQSEKLRKLYHDKWLAAQRALDELRSGGGR